MDAVISFFDRNNIEYYTNFDFSQISTIKLGETGSLVVFPKNEMEFVKILKFFYSKKIYFRVFGNMSNVLVVEKIDYPVIVTSRMQNEVTISGNYVNVSAGVTIPKLCEYAKKYSLSGIEGLSGIPATVGGAILSNAGAFGCSISDNLVSVKVFSCGKIFNLYKSDIKFMYHSSNLSGFIILSAVFLFENKNEYDIIKMSNELTFKRNKTQPSGYSLGSVFKKINGNSAGFYIERCGLKGKRVGGVVVSSKHANFFINDAGGSVSDFLELLSFVENTVMKNFGLTLTTEIEKVGNKNEVTGRLSRSFKF